MMQRHPRYKLIARVYSRPPAAERQAADKYMRGYEKAHPGILPKSYNNQPLAKLQTFHFIGNYNDVHHWVLVLKEEIDGKVN